MSLFTLKYKFESITNPSLILYKYNKEQKQDLNISLASTLEKKGCGEEVDPSSTWRMSRRRCPRPGRSPRSRLKIFGDLNADKMNIHEV